MRDLLGRGGQVRLLAGDYLGITEPNALLRLLDLQQGTTGTFDVRLFESQGRGLHPGAGREVKIDFLAGPLGKFNDPKRVSIDSRRVKPKPSVNLHAHSADEAVAYDLEPLTVPVHGARSNHETKPRFSYLKVLPTS